MRTSKQWSQCAGCEQDDERERISKRERREEKRREEKRREGKERKRD